MSGSIDPAIQQIARALARQAAREDHAASLVRMFGDGRSSRSESRGLTMLQPGTIVATKVPTMKSRSGAKGTVHQVGPESTVEVMLDGGLATVARDEIRVLRDQAPLPPPMRHALPYGMWKCSDGREVLFNRDYKPIWQRMPGRVAEAADPEEWVPYVEQRWFYRDGKAPWSDPTILSETEALLGRWIAGRDVAAVALS